MPGVGEVQVFNRPGVKTAGAINRTTGCGGREGTRDRGAAVAIGPGVRPIGCGIDGPPRYRCTPSSCSAHRRGMPLPNSSRHRLRSAWALGYRSPRLLTAHHNPPPLPPRVSAERARACTEILSRPSADPVRNRSPAYKAAASMNPIQQIAGYAAGGFRGERDGGNGSIDLDKACRTRRSNRGNL